MLSFARPQAKTLTVKLRLLQRKTSVSGISLTLYDESTICPIQISQYCERLNKVVGATLLNTDYPVL